MYFPTGKIIQDILGFALFTIMIPYIIQQVTRLYNNWPNILPFGENLTKLTGGLSSSINVFKHCPDAVSHIRHSPEIDG